MYTLVQLTNTERCACIILMSQYNAISLALCPQPVASVFREEHISMTLAFGSCRHSHLVRPKYYLASVTFPVNSTLRTRTLNATISCAATVSST